MNLAKSLVRTAALALAVGLFTAGCATQGYKKADRTGINLQNFRKDVVEFKQALDASLARLNEVSQAAATNPRPAFEAYTKSLTRLGAASRRTDKQAQTLQKQGEAYFQQWQRDLETINNPEIRQVAQERKEQQKQLFERLDPLMKQLWSHYDPLFSDLQDLRKLLSQDLTESGIRAAAGLIRRNTDLGASVQSHLDEVAREAGMISDGLMAARTPIAPDAKAAPK
ncbi:MAG TPA: DUF2959 family protein [Verrucomicrobiota bacterium]|jgi:hypothetical protein|nr:DUF2959 family protein [Verrucomicrobiota bacterium]HRT09880.1 DUF2959 family protein [Candidatus Paceibacterota bacterium]